VVKLIGSGEYAVERAGEDLAWGAAGLCPARTIAGGFGDPLRVPITIEGHFGLAVDNYTHATAPNRRYADLVTQRLIKAVVAGGACPYSDDELGAIAARCTRREGDARSVERKLRKVAAALLLAPRVGETFDAVVTGKSNKGTFARLLSPPAEGRVVRGEQALDVGDRVRVRLLATDPARGYIDFAAA
jgi:exoribonuclease R